MRSLPLLLGALALAGVLSGCGAGLHLTESHGRAFNAAFLRQRVNPEGSSEARAVRGLDPQEAALISAGYRKQLGPRGTAARETPPLILLNPEGQAAGGYVPPPSPGAERR